MENLHKSCLSCGKQNLQELPEDYKHAYLVRCADCGLVFGQRIPSQEELLAHYAQYTRDNSISPITVKRYEELLDQFESYRKNNRILDVGCGDGHFLAVAKRRGWEVTGTEYTDEAVQVCKAKGIQIHQGDLKTMENSSFDVITSFEVLEHIHDGPEHADKIVSLLRSGGLFYFTTPNFNSFSRKWLGGKWNVIEYPEHLTYYTVKTITQLLEAHGLSKISIRTTGFSPQRFKLSVGKAKRSGNSDEGLRTAMEEKILLKIAKKSVNTLLNIFRSGDTLKGFFLKP